MFKDQAFSHHIIYKKTKHLVVIYYRLFPQKKNILQTFLFLTVYIYKLVIIIIKKQLLTRSDGVVVNFFSITSCSIFYLFSKKIVYLFFASLIFLDTECCFKYRMSLLEKRGLLFFHLFLLIFVQSKLTHVEKYTINSR